MLLTGLVGCGTRPSSGSTFVGGTPSPSAVVPAASPVVAPTATPSPTAIASPTAIRTSPALTAEQRRMAAAARLVRGKPGYLGIVVRDRRTGRVWRAGDTRHLTWTASTIKLAIVTDLLERARSGKIQLDATARQQIADILDFSSDDGATSLWNRYGGATRVPRFRQAYGMTGLTFVSGFPEFWGHMKCTAEDLLRLMSYVLDRLHPADRDLILAGMRDVGQIQRWGVWSAGAKLVMYHLPPGARVDAGVHAVSDLVATYFGAPTPARVTVPDPSTGL